MSTDPPVRTAPAAPARPARLALAVLSAVLTVPLVTAAHHSRATPFGDRLTAHVLHAPARTRPAAGHAPGAEPAVRVRGAVVEAYDRASGRGRWTHARDGRRALAVLPVPGHAVALWSDGFVTDTDRADGRRVRWHRAIPDFRGRGTGVLQALDPYGRMVAVVTPDRVAAYRSADGDLRWTLPARPGCAFAPARQVRARGALLIAQPCAGPEAWSEELVAVDDLGRIVPGRQPLGNALPGERGRKAVAGAR
ncbi:PQQ-binding-like beta-propeller repeat protein [Streptomyces sp. NPDC001941]|uniref:PQQ-binding-like beta-propeller repeat protein n=1 Tax=Streptomyces sp. NPDC001941 TaxID=3154659 RepID=UPI0033292A10